MKTRYIFIPYLQFYNLKFSQVKVDNLLKEYDKDIMNHDYVVFYEYCFLYSL